jgi:large subunit ribosomal protein L9
MKVILLSDVYKHGVAGEVIDVADGFARNWLLPQKLALKATNGALKQQEALRAQAAARRAQLDQRLNDLARLIDGVELFFGRRASPTGKLFGSVTTSEIADALNQKTGIDINRRRISQTALREVGTHDVPVRLGTEISPVLKITIVREEDLQRVIAERAAAAQAAETADAAVEVVEVAEVIESNDAGEVVAEVVVAEVVEVTHAGEVVADVVVAEVVEVTNAGEVIDVIEAVEVVETKTAAAAE